MRAIPIITLSLSPLGLLLAHGSHQGEQTNAASSQGVPPVNLEPQVKDDALALFTDPIPNPIEAPAFPEFSTTLTANAPLVPPTQSVQMEQLPLPQPVQLPDVGPELINRIIHRSIAANPVSIPRRIALEPTATSNPLSSPAQNAQMLALPEPAVISPTPHNNAAATASETTPDSQLNGELPASPDSASDSFNPVQFNSYLVAHRNSSDAADSSLLSESGIASDPSAPHVSNPSSGSSAEPMSQAANPEQTVSEAAATHSQGAHSSSLSVPHPSSLLPQAAPKPTDSTLIAQAMIADTNRVAGQHAPKPESVDVKAVTETEPTGTEPTGTELSLSTDDKPDAPAAQPMPAPPSTAPIAPVAQAVPRTNQPASLPSPIPNTPLNESYLLGAGDVIQITIANVPEYSGSQQLLVDGTVNLPLVGSLPLSGLTLKQAEAIISERYAAELEFAVVTVSLSQPRALQVALAGEIAQPGLYALAANQGGQFPTVVQAIQTAGGATQAADLQQVQVRRRDQSGVLRTFSVNLLELLQVGDITQNASLRDGDIVFIPATSEINLAASNQLAVSNLRTNTDQPVAVAVVGEVSRPGPYRLEGGQPTLIQLIQQAGGITPSANLREIAVHRQTRQGTEQVVAIDLWDVLQTGDLTQDLVLQQGDRITVPTAEELPSDQAVALAASTLSTGVIQVNIMGEIESPGQIELRANSTLNQAILAAGGFNGRASRKDIRLIRFNPNGTVTQQELEVDLAQGLDPTINPLLRNNDVIIVGRSTGAEITDALSNILNIIQLVSPFPALF